MLETVILIRGIERIVIQCGALLLIILGMFLFKWGISDKSNLILKRKGFKFQLLNGTPGLFLALFGTVILLMGIHGKLGIEGDLSSLQKFQSTKQVEESSKEPNRRVSLLYIDAERNPLRNFRNELKKISTSLDNKSNNELKSIIQRIVKRYEEVLKTLERSSKDSSDVGVKQ